MTARGAFDIWVTSTELPSLIAAFPELGLLVRWRRAWAHASA